MFFIITSPGAPLGYIIGLFLIQLIPLLDIVGVIEDGILWTHESASIPALQFYLLLFVLFAGLCLTFYSGSIHNVARNLQEILRGILSRRFRVTDNLDLNIESFLITSLILILVMLSLLRILQTLSLFPDTVTLLTPTQFRNLLIVIFIAIKWIRSFCDFFTAGDNRENETKTHRIHDIVDIVKKMPVEEFVAHSDSRELRKNNYQCCSVSDLKRMLSNRGCTNFQKMVERKDLIEELDRLRNYCDTCCICCEEYTEGDALRVLPKCRHEFHVECFDQWAFTFANGTKRSRDPCCPLCNTVLH